MISMPKIAVLVLNWNGKRFLETCMESVLNQTYPNYDVYLIDNGSTDGSVRFVKEVFPRVRVIALNKNYGFAEGYNKGIRKVLEDTEVEYLVLLNNDTRVVKNWLQELMNVVRKKKCGMVASKMMFMDSKKVNSVGMVVYKSGLIRDLGFNEEDRFSKVIEVFGPCGGAALYSRTLLEDVKLDDEYFDADFFVYFEDADLNFRARLLGYRCFLSPKAIVYHEYSGTNKPGSDFSVFLQERNQLFFLVRCFPLTHLIEYFPLILLSKFVRFSLALKRNQIKVYFKAIGSFIKNLGKLIRKRYLIKKQRDVSQWFKTYPWIKVVFG